MKGNILIIAALGGELKPLVQHPTAKSWRRVKSAGGTELWEYRHADGCWLAACAGMGGDRATIAHAEAAKRATPDAICSIGWAGSLTSAIGAEAVCSAALVLDTKTGERFRPTQWLAESPVLASTSQVADEKEKQRLAATYGAGLVDMEAASVARIALGQQIPFYCLKAVSDDSSANLPNINPFIGSDGQLKMLPFLLHVARRPAALPALVKLGRHSSAAARNLAEAVYEWLDEDASTRISTGDYTRSEH